MRLEAFSRVLKTTALLALLFPAAAIGTSAQDISPAPSNGAVAVVPFGVGERVTYGVHWGIFGRRGSATSEVLSVDTLRGRPSYHLSFNLKGRVTFFGIDDTQESWLDVSKLHSHRFKQNLNQTNYKRLRTLDFFPDDMMWRQVEKPDSGALDSDNPLDDVSFLYWVRTLELEVGQRYEFRRYFKESGNPVIVHVLRKEVVTVKAGTFNTIVVRPEIKTSGMFKEGSAEVWFSDDEKRLVVQMKTDLPVGKATMKLESYTPGRSLSSGNGSSPRL
jgi:hypothetical protein